MSSRTWETLAVIAVVTTVLVVGCSSGFGPTFPAPDKPSDDAPANDTPTNDAPTNDTPTNDTPTNDTPTNDTPTNDTPTNDTPTNDTPTNDTPTNGMCPPGSDVNGHIWLRVLEGESYHDVAHQGTVTMTDGQTLTEIHTDPEGLFCADGIDPGWYGFSVQSCGKPTEMATVEFTGDPIDVVLRLEDFDVMAYDQPPVFVALDIELIEPGLVRLTGTIENMDGPNVVVFHNGQSLGLFGSGTAAVQPSFTPPLFFLDEEIPVFQGNNEFVVFAANCVGGTLSPTVSYNGTWYPEE